MKKFPVEMKNSPFFEGIEETEEEKVLKGLDAHEMTYDKENYIPPLHTGKGLCKNIPWTYLCNQIPVSPEILLHNQKSARNQQSHFFYLLSAVQNIISFINMNYFTNHFRFLLVDFV